MNTNLIIYTDATCDLPQDIIDALGIKVIPMSCMVGDRNYLGTKDDSISAKQVYDLMKKGQKTSTGQIPPVLYEELFEAELAKGNDVLHINLSSGLTGAFEQAQKVQVTLAEKYPKNKLYLVDSLCAALGEGLIVYKTAMFYKENKDVKKTFEYAKRLVSSVCAIFTVDDLKYLRAGGRISAAKAFIGTLLQMKPVMHVNTEGKLVAFAKVMGRKKALNSLVNAIEKTYDPQNNDIIAIGHGDCLENAEYVGQAITQRLGINKIIYNYIGPVIGSHSGPGTLALFFEGKNKGIDK